MGNSALPSHHGNPREKKKREKALTTAKYLSYFYAPNNGFAGDIRDDT